MTETEKWKLMFFAAIKTHVILPSVLTIGKPLSEINRMTYETMLEICRLTENGQGYDFNRLKESYEEGEWLYEHDR